MLERHPELKPLVVGVVFIDSFIENGYQYWEEAGIAKETIDKGIHEKHAKLHTMACCMNCCAVTGCGACIFGGPKPKKGKDGADTLGKALMWGIFTSSKTGWTGLLHELTMSTSREVIDQKAPLSMGDIPITVITGSWNDQPLDVLEAKVEQNPKYTENGIPMKEALAAFKRVKVDLVALSSRAKHIDTKLSHMVHFEDPELVLGAIREYLPEASVPQQKMT